MYAVTVFFNETETVEGVELCLSERVFYQTEEQARTGASFYIGTERKGGVAFITLSTASFCDITGQLEVDSPPYLFIKPNGIWQEF